MLFTFYSLEQRIQESSLKLYEATSGFFCLLLTLNLNFWMRLCYIKHAVISWRFSFYFIFTSLCFLFLCVHWSLRMLVSLQTSSFLVIKALLQLLKFVLFIYFFLPWKCFLWCIPSENMVLYISHFLSNCNCDFYTRRKKKLIHSTKRLF